MSKSNKHNTNKQKILPTLFIITPVTILAEHPVGQENKPQLGCQYLISICEFMKVNIDLKTVF